MERVEPEHHTRNPHPHRQGKVRTNGLSLHYLDDGNATDPVILLVMGLGAQLTVWPQSLVDNLVADGFRVIRFDNRDIGLSDQVNNGLRVNLTRSMLTSRARLPMRSNYTLFDMVRDTVGLIDGLGIKQAHIVGASMGGMIAQLFAAIYPHRTLSLTSIMSTTNEPGLPLPRWDLLLHLGGYGVKKGHDKHTAVERSLKFWKKISSPDYHTPDHEVLDRLARDYDRSYRPGGILRQSHAIVATGGFKRLLTRINRPTQIIHGTRDPLVHMKGGIDSANAIRNAKLELIAGMGHDFPQQLLPKLTDLILSNARQGSH